MRRLAPALFAAGCILHPEPDLPSRGTAYYSGVITAVEERTGFPLEGVRVVIIDRPGLPFWEGLTNRLGRARFSMRVEPEEPIPEVFVVQFAKRGRVRKKVLFDPDDFRAAPARGRSRKTVRLRPGRGSETVDMQDAGGE